MNAIKSDVYNNAKPGKYPDQKYTAYANQDMKARAIGVAVDRLKNKLKKAKGAAVPPQGKGRGQELQRQNSPAKAQPSPAGNAQLFQTRSRLTTQKAPLGQKDRPNNTLAEQDPKGRGGLRG